MRAGGPDSAVEPFLGILGAEIRSAKEYQLSRKPGVPKRESTIKYPLPQFHPWCLTPTSVLFEC